MKTCKHCGSPVPETDYRGRFTATQKPPVVYYDGHALPLAAMPARLLIRLAEADFVSREDLLAIGLKSLNSMRVHISAMRRVLPDGVTLECRTKKGYRLVLPRGLE